MSASSRIYIGIIAVLGSGSLLSGLSHWESAYPARFAAYLVMAIFAAGLKITLPSVTGTLSVNFLFILFGVIEMSLPETLVIGCAITALQCLWGNRGNGPSALKVLFNTANMAIAITAAFKISHLAWFSQHRIEGAPITLVAAGVLFLANTIPVAGVIAVTESVSLRKTWQECYFWTLPYYMVGAAIAELMSATHHYVGWQTSLLVVPVIYLVYRSYRLYLDRLMSEKKHAEEVAALHLRTIESLALAIEAKDTTTHAHLRRVQIYALELGKAMNLSKDELDALRAGALLHDIGKLAVPEHIISKPGRLTPEEFEKVKIHPLVGAEILDRVQFPYPVVPIVRSHHEKWDGSGYPSGLRGEEIPIGARIIAAVDSLDALATDRQYRRALNLDAAMESVVAESGKAFDPKVIDVLKQHYREWERLAQTGIGDSSMEIDLPINKGGSPAAGLDLSQVETEPRSTDFLHSIASARQEVQTLFELTQELGNSLSLDETLSVLGLRLKRMIPWDSMAVYIKRDGALVPEYVSGDDFRFLASLQIQVGTGLSGWVAANGRPILNGNPNLERNSQNDTSKPSRLDAALAVPFEGLNGIIGVLTLYRTSANAFTRDHLRILLAISAKVGLAIENALRYRQAESSATTDYLTGLPNARSLFLHLDSELARARRGPSPVTVLVCDLDGFKAVNDRFGHFEGNKVLREVAAGLRFLCREYDYVARMGGDEFVIVLPGTFGEAITSRLDAFRRVVSDAGEKVCGDAVLTLSVGQSCYPEDGLDAEALLAEADRRMYKEKQASKQKAVIGQRIWNHDPRTYVVQ